MIKIKVFRMEDFLTVVNECTGPVTIHYPDGRKENINGQKDLQQQLKKQYQENKDTLSLVLDIPTPQDYLNIVFFSISNF